MERIELRVHPEDAESAQAYLSERMPQGWQEREEPDGELVFTLHLADTELADELAENLGLRFPEAGLSRDAVDEANWSLAWMDFFTPIIAGETFEVLPPWLADEDTHGRTAIVIHPGMAFGTGQHATTALCLEVLSELWQSGHIRTGTRYLDLGTGTGILAISLAKLGLDGWAVDIDPQAITAADENVAANQVETGVRTAVGSLEVLPEGERFDVVVANILSGPLIELAPALAARVADGGVLVLSGILVEQGPGVASAYMALGLPAPRTIERGEWVVLAWDSLQSLSR